jgi:hypothetical protein
MNVPWARTARYGAVSTAILLLVAIGVFASLNATRTRPAPIGNTLSSPEAAAEAVIDAMQDGDLDRLRSLALTEDEFRAHIWPHLPASRPERNVPFDFAWSLLQQTSEGHLRQTAAHLREAPVLKRVRFGGPMSVYGELVVHRDTELVVLGSTGDEKVIRLFGSMVEQGGRWKVFSYVVD